MVVGRMGWVWMEAGLLRWFGGSPDLGLERSIWAAGSAGGGEWSGGHSTFPPGRRGLCPLPSPHIVPPLEVRRGEWWLGTGGGCGGACRTALLGPEPGPPGSLLLGGG